MTAQKVRDIAAGAFADAIDVRSIIETLEAGNSPAAVAAINAAGTDRVAQCVCRSLWSRLLVIVARAYAPARSGDLHARHAFDLLKDAATRSDVLLSGDKAVLEEAERLWLRCCGDHRLQQLLAYRDKEIAHRGEWTSKLERPIINDIFHVSRETARSFEKLAQGSGVVALSLDSQLLGYSERSARFWLGGGDSCVI